MRRLRDHCSSMEEISIDFDEAAGRKVTRIERLLRKADPAAEGAFASIANALAAVRLRRVKAKSADAPSNCDSRWWWRIHRTYRLFRTGVIAGGGSQEHNGDDAGTSEAVMIDKIADDGVTVTVTISDSDTGESSKQILVPYDEEITVAISKDATVVARLGHVE